MHGILNFNFNNNVFREMALDADEGKTATDFAELPPVYSIVAEFETF